MTLREIETRLAAIAQEVETDGADLDALENEAKDLKEQRSALLAKAEQRNRILGTVAGMTGTPVTTNPTPVETRDFAAMTREELLASPEYRTAWSKHILRRDMTDTEQRAFTIAASSAGPAIPTELADEILRKAQKHAPLLSEITLMHVPGGVTIAVEGTVNDAAEHTEGSTITASADTLTSVTLSQYEITKLVTASKSVMRMAIPAFEAWLVDQLAESLARKIVQRILTGTGSSQATGVDKANTWDATNSVTVAKASALTTTDVLNLIGLLPGGYDANAKFVMSKKTLFADFLPLQDKAKNDIVRLEGGTYYVQGYPVLLDDYVTLHEAYLGNFKKYIGNMGEEITVTSDFDLPTNSYQFLGSCMFDGKPAIGDAFRKLIKATA